MLSGEQRITTHLCDVRDLPGLTRVAKECGPFQVIIDDGSHQLGDVLCAYHALWPFLVDGGLYVIEDIQNQEILDLFAAWPGAVIYDLRAIRNRYDDVLVVMEKRDNHESAG